MVRAAPLPRSKIVYDPVHSVDGEYTPAILNSDAMVTGVKKYKSKQKVFILEQEKQILLRWLTLMYGHVMSCPMWTQDKAIDEIDGERAAGSPYDFVYGPLKHFALKFLNFNQFLLHFCFYNQVHRATLKDELRLKGKIARLFVPINICMIAIGNWLFGAQNDSFVQFVRDICIKIGLPSPSYVCYKMWGNITRWSGYSTDGDGSWWDALTPLCLVEVVRDFRKKFLPETVHPFVDKYYNQVYAGYTNVMGHLVTLDGQLSGQTNTTTDNSLIHSCIMMLHAIRHGMSYDEFRQQVEWYVVGDDLIYNTTSSKFTALQLEQTWRSFGMFLESRGYVSPDELMFVGMKPQQRVVDGNTYSLYVFRARKNLESMNYYKKGATISQRLSTLVNLTMGIFADKEYFDFMKSVTYNFAAQNNGVLTEIDYRLLSMLDEQVLLDLYTGFE